MQKLRRSFINLTGYWIYKKKHLSTGVDFAIDIENFYPTDYQNIRTVFDIGANNGQSAAKYAQDFPNSKIYSFEPELQTFEKLKTNTSNLPQVSVFNMGIGAENGSLELYHGKYSEWNSFVPGLNDTGEKSIVEVKKVDDFAQENGLDKIDVLKTDTEGFDLNVLKGAKGLMNQGKIKFIYIEAGFYSSNERNTNLFEIMEYLKDFDFELFAVYEVGKGGSHMVNGNAMFVHKSATKERVR
jgi:FkbM family methyltransferase